MKRISLLFTLTCLIQGALWAQMANGTDTLYGNEWIQFDQQYFRFQVAEDGIYRIDGNTLQSILPGGVNADQLRLYYFGQEIPIYSTTDNAVNANDYIEFFGRRNRTELDAYMFKNPSLHFHPDYSLFTDTSSYYLTWTNSESNQRYDVVQNDLNNLPPKEEFLWFDNYTRFTDMNIKKSVNIGGANVQSSLFADAEGFCDGYASNTSKTKEINYQEVFSDGPDAEMTVRYAARSGNHHQKVYLNGNLYAEDIFSGYFGRVLQFDVPAEECLPTTNFYIEGTADNADKQTISVIHTRYPRTLNMLGNTHFQFILEGAVNKKYFEFENFLTDGVAPILYDVTNHYKLETTLENGLVKFAVPPSLEARTIVVVNPLSGYKTPSAPKEIQFIDYSQEDAEFVIITDPVLREGPTDWVEEYAKYRSQEAPDLYSTYIVHIEDIYDQFGYGVPRHSQSVRNFAHFVDKEWSDIQYFFVIGKGREYKDIRHDYELETNYHTNFFVPTFGHPGSDHLLFSTNFTALPLAPVGRLAAKTPEEVRIYLEKVKQFENLGNLNQTFEEKAWMKRVMHLGGGGDAFEQNQIRTSLRGMEDIIEQNRFGAEVTSFFKTSTDPIETSQSAALKETINQGLAILTFFGHSSPNIFDFNFDDPNSYENTGRYPLLFSMGCFSGNCHTDNTGIGERFVLEDQRGAIAYVGSTGYGFIAALDVFGDEFYSLAGTTMYGETIGNLIYESSKILDNSPVVGEYELAQQTTYQGDPALRLYPLPGPDYVVDNRSVSFTPSLLNLQVDSFDFQFTIGNIGQHIPDTSFSIRVEQKIPSGERITLLEQEIEAPAYSQELTLRLPMLGPEAIGFNRFYVEIDILDQISELPLEAESNNRLVDNNGQEGIGVFIVSNDIRPVFPPEFGIVNDPELLLKASSLNAFAQEQTFLIQLDTSETFDNPLATGTARQIGGVFSWKPNIILENERVYYWRVSPEDVDNVGYRWQNSSFVYVENGPEGWNQSHYYQFAKDEPNNMELLPTTRRLDFIDDIIDVKTRNVVLDFPASIPRYYRGSASQLAYSGTAMTNAVPAGLLIGVLDTINVEPLTYGGNGQYGGDYGGTSQKGWLFKTDTEAQRAEVINFLQNEVPEGYYVVFMTVQRSDADSYLPESWAQDSINLGTNLFQVLEAEGATMIRSLADSGPLPYSRIYQKGNPDFLGIESIGNPSQFDENTAGIPGNWIEGSLFSTPIGPAAEWEDLNWNYNFFDPSYDEVHLNLYAITEAGTDSLVYAEVSELDLELEDIDARRYPFLRLEYFARDEVQKSAANLDRWRVSYTGLPEAALNPAGYFAINGDTLFRGEPLEVTIAVENLGIYDMDSLMVRFVLRDQTNQEWTFDQLYPPLLKGDSLHANLRVSTDEMGGSYSLLIDVNPDEHQPELTHINNTGILNFYVADDEKNPLLEVTFDGVRIMDGDLVSASPLINIGLLDENPYLAISDTSLFELLLVHPDGQEELLTFADERITFFPSSGGNKNLASVEFHPTFSMDGLYSLYIAAADASGNESGNLNYVVSSQNYGYDYKVSFEVITKAMISNVLNYPNPFSNATRFVYTLTGSEPPAFFKIQILTVSGRIVREITQLELGPMKIGTHKTDFVWDGTDQFGDPLANGVYLYRVVAQKADGSNYEMYETGADAFFKKGFGKLVILR